MNTLSDSDEGKARPSVWAVCLAVDICFAAALTSSLIEGKLTKWRWPDFG